MKTVYKYSLEHQPFTMPAGAEPLAVALQDPYLYLWAAVDTEAEDALYEAVIVGTGWNLETGRVLPPYVGTVHEPPDVWHVFVGPASEDWNGGDRHVKP